MPNETMSRFKKNPKPPNKIPNLSKKSYLRSLDIKPKTQDAKNPRSLG
jgi:hypothetical protein